jgi:hypothetical protein
MPHSLPRPNVVASTARTGAITSVAREQEPERPKYKEIPDKRKTQTTLVKRSLCCSITWSMFMAQRAPLDYVVKLVRICAKVVQLTFSVSVPNVEVVRRPQRRVSGHSLTRRRQPCSSGSCGSGVSRLTGTWREMSFLLLYQKRCAPSLEPFLRSPTQWRA